MYIEAKDKKTPAHPDATKKKKKTSGMYMKNSNLTENCKMMTSINSAAREKYRIAIFNSRHNYLGS